MKNEFFGPGAINIGSRGLAMVIKNAQQNYAEDSSFRISKFNFVFELKLF